MTIPRQQRMGDSHFVGRMEVSRISISSVVLEGVGKPVLRRAVGHIPGTALPGQGGNVGIAGHRDMFFHPLRNAPNRFVVRARGTFGPSLARISHGNATEPI